MATIYYSTWHCSLRAGRVGSHGMLGYSLLQQIKELEITSWPGFPSEIGRTDIVGREKGPGSCMSWENDCCGKSGGLALINPLSLEHDIETFKKIGSQGGNSVVTWKGTLLEMRSFTPAHNFLLVFPGKITR